MDPFSSMDISASALSALRVRMNVIADNLANVETTRTREGGPYRKKEVVFGAVQDQSFGNVLFGLAQETPGVQLLGVVQSQTPPRRVLNPSHPDANEQGFVLMPDINPLIEMVDMLSATRAYEANVTAIQSWKAMTGKALEIGR
jgi:flagellar basal-body rod protein FlgC